MTDRATQYAREVVAGKIVAGNLHIQACRRHLQDLERQDTDGFPYIWNPETSERVLEYAETLTIAEGFEPKPVQLYGFQCFDLGVPFGWYKRNGFRRFRRMYKSVARQNGKSFENGIRGTYIAGFSGYQFGKLFTVATKKRQSRIAWDEMNKFISADPDLKELFRVQEYKSLITALQTNCTIEALSREGGLDDGFRSIFASIDEIHQHRDNSIYKAIYNGTRSLKETLISMITTRGKNLNSFCYEMDEYAQNILHGVSSAEDFFVDIYSLDEGDDPFDEKNFVKANPLLARTDDGIENLRTDASTAKNMGGSELSDYLTKAMNIWTMGHNGYIDKEKWKACGSDRTLEAFRDKACYVGLDLSSGGDLTTIALEFPCDDGSNYFYSHSFMPRGRFEEHIQTDLAPYDIWEREGLLTVTGGVDSWKNDYSFILSHLRKLQETYELKFLGIAYDPHNADGILSELESFGCPLLMVTQSARFLNDATVDLQLSVKSGTVEYDRKNQLMTWSFVNAKVEKNSFGEIKVDKEKHARHQRIDPVDACIDAHVMRLKDRGEVDVQASLANYMEVMGWTKGGESNTDL